MSTFTLRHDLPSISNGMLYVQADEIIVPKFETEQGIVCAYCGGMYSSKLFKCPNCAAPRTERPVKESKYIATYGEVFGLIYEPFEITKSNCVLKIKEQIRYEFFNTETIKILVGNYTAPMLVSVINSMWLARGVRAQAYSQDGRIVFRTGRKGCGESIELLQCRNSILLTLGFSPTTTGGSVGIQND